MRTRINHLLFMLESPQEHSMPITEKPKKTSAESGDKLLQLKNVLEIDIDDVANKIFAGAEYPSNVQKEDCAAEIEKVIRYIDDNNDLGLAEFQILLSSLEVKESIKDSLEIAKNKFFIPTSS